MGLEVIRSVMQRQGVTSDMLSQMSGVPKSTIDKIASGATDNPRYKSLQKLVDALGMSMDDFIRLVDDNPGTGEDDQMLAAFHNMNEEGRTRALQLLSDMVDSGHYAIQLKKPGQE
ncbi:MAG: helix-turn-helix transcriptional regulator [Clostridia bacterium]|nr:helix-turn-helix transcriptional regulator [Clostridia bacterium]